MSYPTVVLFLRNQQRYWTAIPTQIGDIPTTTIPKKSGLPGETTQIL